MKMSKELLLKELPKEFAMFKVSAVLGDDGIALRVVNVGLATVTAKKINYDQRRINHADYLSPSGNASELSLDKSWKRTTCCSAKEHIEKAKELLVEKIINNQKIYIGRLEKEIETTKSYKDLNVCSLKEYMEE
jgi:hypothetical protein